VSLDIFLKRFADDPAGANERNEVLALLGAHTCCGPDAIGTYFVTLEDGIVIELLAQELRAKERFEGCAFRVRRRELSLAVCALMLDIAKAADMVILPVRDAFAPILISEAQAARFPAPLAARFPASPICLTAEELHTVLCEGHAGWRRLRAGGSATADQLVRTV
jgi:hypothetical protein